MLFLVLPSTIVWASVSPCFYAKAMLLVVFKLTSICIPVNIPAGSIAWSDSFYPLTTICIFTFSRFCTLSILKPPLLFIWINCIAIIECTFSELLWIILFYQSIICVCLSNNGISRTFICSVQKLLNFFFFNMIVIVIFIKLGHKVVVLRFCVVLFNTIWSNLWWKLLFFVYRLQFKICIT